MMMPLHPHPITSDRPLINVGVQLERKGACLWVRFVTLGAVDTVQWPDPAEPVRTDDLWRHSCFEVFVETTDGYREFNLSPSGQWASYRFDGYRHGMRDAVEVADVVPVDLADDMLALEAHIYLPLQVGKLGLSAVVEAIDGSFTYWALVHPSDKPDFHHPDSFILDLP
ncbi:MAG: DOMON-like domain-containing protein [Pseudomonadota bacterium]